MARDGRGGLGLGDRLILLVAWVTTCGLVYLLGFYVGKGTQAHSLRLEQQVVRLPATSAPPPEGQHPKTAPEFGFYDKLMGEQGAERLPDKGHEEAKPAPAAPALAREAVAATPAPEPVSRSSPPVPPAAVAAKPPPRPFHPMADVPGRRPPAPAPAVPSVSPRSASAAPARTEPAGARTLRAGATWPARGDLRTLAREGNLIPVCREILADLETPVSAFLKIHRGPYGFLLESVEGGEKWGRYSFLGTEPARVFRSRGRTVEIETPGRPPERRTVDDPFEALRRLLAEYRPVSVPGLPRFARGAGGTRGYEMARAFERLPERAADDLGLPDACLLLAESLLVFDNMAQKIKVVSHVHVREGESLEAAYDAAVARIDALVARLAVPPVEPAPVDAAPGEVRSNFTQAAYEKIVARAKEYIRAGDVIQVVLAQRFELPLAAAPFDVYRCLRTVNPSPYMFYLALGDHALAGASPEVMVRVEDGEVTVRPIAGTRPRGTVEREDVALAAELAADPKERAEHVMLLDLGRNDVGRVAAIGTVQVTESFVIERYSHVMHLVPNVRP